MFHKMQDYISVKTCGIYFFVSKAPASVWFLFNGILALLVSLFYVIREFDRFLHQDESKMPQNADKARNFAT